jgi:glycerol-3-phosphate dehydrogenase (NAD(P)+)
MAKVAIIGTTIWGVTLVSIIARKEVTACIWARTKEEAQDIISGQPQARHLPNNLQIPKYSTVTSSIKEATEKATAIIMAVPTQEMRQNIRLVAPHIQRNTLVVSAAKGLEFSTGLRMSEVICQEISPAFRRNVCVLSGPNLAWEILQGLPALTVVAAQNNNKARKIQKLINTTNFCVYTNTDIIGVELGGALKNIIALGAGIIDGLNLGNNTKSALVTRGLTEISAMGVALGASPITFSGLSGLGDLVTTCASTLSRNHYVGVELAKGRSLKDIIDSMDSVAEGVATTKAAWELSEKMGIEMPITEKLYQVLYKGHAPRKAAKELMEIAAAHELAGRRWRLFDFFRRRRRKLPPAPDQ